MALGFFFTAAWRLAAGLFHGVMSLPSWLKMTLMALLALALWTWWVNDRAYDRGMADQASIDRIKIGALGDNITRLKEGITVGNGLAERARADALAREAKDNAAAANTLAEMEAARRREAARGPGAVQMNAFMRETFR